MECVNIRITIFFLLLPSMSSFDLRTKYFRSDADANGTEFYSLDILGLVEKHGRQVEWHNVTTDDGYILSLFRIPPNPVFHNKTEKSRPIYLHHGYPGTADLFIVLGPGRSVVYALSDAGYDVWLGNSRGNPYSRRHVKYSPDDSIFWDFSLDDYALLDLPAFFDYILKITGSPQLSYLGHSLGTTLIIILQSEKPEYDSKLSAVVHYAPVAYWKTWTLGRFSLGFVGVLLRIFVPSGALEFPIQTIIIPAIVHYICLSNRFILWFCKIPFNVLLGDDQDQVDIPNESVYLLGHYPTASSAKVLQHYSQHLTSGKFGHYEYGSAASNRKAYGQDEAPEYNVSNIRAPTIIFGGKNDPLATLENIDEFIKRLHPDVEVIYKIMELEKFSHGDFLFAEDKLIHEPMIETLEGFFKSKETK